MYFVLALVLVSRSHETRSASGEIRGVVNRETERVLTFDPDVDLCGGRLADAVGGRAHVDAGVLALDVLDLQGEALLADTPRG